MPLKNINRKLVQSEEYLKKAKKLIPSCTQTFSKGPTQFVQGIAPAFLERGSGCHVYDVDGNAYLDYGMALGAVILGYAYEPTRKILQEQLSQGTVFTLPHPLEVQLAELLVELIPSAEMVRFGKNGSDVTAGAVRVARAYTGREKVACSGYHGWQDWYIGTTTRNLGVPEAVRDLTFPFQYNKIDSLKKIFQENRNEIAAVILEPVGVVQPENGFLEKVKDITHENKTILIFDEVVTGFRISLGGAQEYYRVTPDLTCLGKAMGNGLPISAVVGKKEIMALFDEVFFSFTFGGEVLSLAAAISTLQEIKNKKVIEHLWRQGEKLRKGYNSLASRYGLEKYSRTLGLPPRTMVEFKDKQGQEDLALKSLFQQEAIKRGVLFTGAHNLSFSHTDADIDATLAVYEEVMKILKEAIDQGDVEARLEGEKVQPVFRKASY